MSVEEYLPVIRMLGRIMKSPYTIRAQALKRLLSAWRACVMGDVSP
jgi:hypothetical protein